MSISNETTVGQIAAVYPLATRVLARHNINFCCGGGLALEKVCENKGLKANELIAEIKNELQTTDENPTQWSERPLGELIDHILEDFHRPLKEELPRLAKMLKKVHKVHLDKDPIGLMELLNVYRAVKEELESHMGKEEEILFPMIRSGNGIMAHGPIAVMIAEHDSAGNNLSRIRKLTNNFQVPEGACNTWTALWHGLEALEQDLHLHIHLENNILFPRALEEVK